MATLEDKYIDLLINKCMNFENTKSALINYYVENKDFINKLVKKLKEKGITDIYLDEENPRKYRQLLKLSPKEIQEDPYFDKSIWNEYAKKKASFLMLKSEYPNLTKGLDAEKIALASKIALDTRQGFYKMQKHNDVPWCIACLPSKSWAKSVFPKDDKAYEKLFNLIGSFCLLNEKDYLKAWDLMLEESNRLVNKLNSLHIKSLHYTNKLGTDFKVSLSPNALWCGLAQDVKCLVNMPSFEIFTSPLKQSAEGIVYASKPLYYNNQKIAQFKLEFKNGQVINSEAKVGQQVLENLIASEEAMHFLGEIALVDKNSPIAQSQINLGTTLLDENASCHIALGEGFPECLKNGNNLSDAKLKKEGLNIAKNHVDLMIGTDDLNIEAETYDGKNIKIMVDGQFDIK